MVGAAAVRVPRADWWPAGVPRSEEEESLARAPSVDYDAALRTAQFPLFFSLVMGNAFAGMILISSAKTIMTDIFAAAMPAVVTSSFAAGYVSSSASPTPPAAPARPSPPITLAPRTPTTSSRSAYRWSARSRRSHRR